MNGFITNYFAVDIEAYAASGATSYISFSNGNPNKVFAGLTSNGDGTFKCATNCRNGIGTYITSTMVFEKTSVSSKDLEKAAAIAESIQSELLANNLMAEYGLSEERAITIAKLASSWNKLAKSRALTDADADAFAKEVAGVNFNQIDGAVKAMENGSLAEMNDLTVKAAAVNGTTSENMAEIMNKLFF